MQRLVQLWETFVSEEEYRLPDHGPLNILDYNEFLERSKRQFWITWEQNVKRIKENPTKDSQYSLKDFQKVKLIGAGSFGQVYLVNNNKTGEFFALKAVLKRNVVGVGQVNNTRTEKLVLQCTNCPFHVRLEYFFKDNSYLYFILPFIQGGELFGHLRSRRKFDEITAMFYIAQIILALEYLHYFNIVYRDVKPENMLLDHTGYIKLTDFGFCKPLSRGHERTYTLCGTPDYLAPEIIRNEGYGKAVDWWAVGVLAYELTTGSPPFEEREDKRKYYKILKGNYNIPDFLSNDLKDLITKTLQVDISRRFGNMRSGVDDFKKHSWFKPLNWQSVVCRKADPPFLPNINGASDTRYFREYDYMSLIIADNLEFGESFADF